MTLKTLKKNLSEADYSAAKNLLKTVKRNSLLKKSSSTSYHLKNFSDEVQFNKTLVILHNARLIEVETSASRRWSSISPGSELFSGLSKKRLAEEKVELYKKEYSLSDSIKRETLTKTPLGFLNTGLRRKGFRTCAGSRFRLDTSMLEKHKTEIVKNLKKGLIDKPFFDDIDYCSAIDIIVQNYIDNPFKNYNLNGLTLDSRGRAIFSCLKKIGNPIGFKIFRSLLILPKINPGLSSQAEEAVFLFIAELLGYKKISIKDKLSAGKQAAARKELPKDLAAKLWLVRLYDELDRYKTAKKNKETNTFFWRVPIELDASASMLGFAGALLGDSDLLSAVNGAGSGLRDPWAVEGVDRNQVKAATMPRLFGSSKTVSELLSGKTATQEQLDILTNLLHSSYFAKADKLKTLLISGVTPAEKMNIKIFNDNFILYCNKFRQIGALPEKYTLLDSTSQSLVEITRAKAVVEPDLDSFRRYFPTLLIHCLDSQAADSVAGKTFKASKFCIPVHDAFVINPNLATKVRGWYAEEITCIYENRKKILTDFFSSINLNDAGYKQVKELLELVKPLPDNWKCRPEILK